MSFSTQAEILNQMRLSIISPRRDQAQALEAFPLWSDVWKFTLVNELKSKSKVFSDPFLNAHEILTLALNGQVVAMILLNWYDLSLATDRGLEYFSHFPSESLESITLNDCTRVMSTTYLTVDPHYRRTSERKLPLAELTVGLALERFRHSEARGAIAVTRNDRKVNDIFFRYGAVPLCARGEQHNVPVDFILLKQESLRQAQDPLVRACVARIWGHWSWSSQKKQAA